VRPWRNGCRTEPDRTESVGTSGETVFEGGDVVDDGVLTARVVGAHVAPVVEKIEMKKKEKERGTDVSGTEDI
jgi:hypothetical protein